MKRLFKRLLYVLVGFLALVGLVTIVGVSLMSKSSEKVSPKNLAILMPTVTPTPQPTRVIVRGTVATATPLATVAPSAEALYRNQLRPWLESLHQWGTDLADALAANPPNSAEWTADMGELEQRANELMADLNAASAPTVYHNGHEMLKLTVESCRDAATHFQQGRNDWGRISTDACIITITLTMDKLRQEGAVN